MVGDISRATLNFDLSKFLLYTSSQGQDLYWHQKLNMYIYWFSSESDSDDDDDDDDNAGHDSTTTRATYHYGSKPDSANQTAQCPSVFFPYSVLGSACFCQIIARLTLAGPAILGLGSVLRLGSTVGHPSNSCASCHNISSQFTPAAIKRGFSQPWGWQSMQIGLYQNRRLL